MKKVNLLFLLIFVSVGFTTKLFAQNMVQINEKRIFFPYFRVHHEPKIILPLTPQQTQVLVDIDGIRAVVKVRQTYKNATTKTLSLACIIPTDLDKFTGTVGKDLVLTKPALAAKEYTEAQQPLFMPDINSGVVIELNWEYHVICEKDQDASVFRFPAFQPQEVDAQVNIHYDLKVSFHTELPLKEITSQEHLIEVNYATTNTAEVVFAKEEEKAGERPLMLRYSFYGADVKITPQKVEEVRMRGDTDTTYHSSLVGKEEDKTSEKTYIITQLYEVKENDYWEKIADKYNVSVTDIKKWNHIKEHSHLKKGQQLKLEVPCLRITHTVEEDEYPYLIAQLYGINTQDLLQWNGLKDSDKLQIGQLIYIYKPKK